MKRFQSFLRRSIIYGSNYRYYCECNLKNRIARRPGHKTTPNLTAFLMSYLHISRAQLPLLTDSDLDSDLRSSSVDHVFVIVCLIVGYTLSISPWLLVLSFVILLCDINCYRKKNKKKKTYSFKLKNCSENWLWYNKPILCFVQ